MVNWIQFHRTKAYYHSLYSWSVNSVSIILGNAMFICLKLVWNEKQPYSFFENGFTQDIDTQIWAYFKPFIGALLKSLI